MKKLYKFYAYYCWENKIYFFFIILQMLLLIAVLSYFIPLHLTGFRLLYLLSGWNFFFSAIFSVVMYYLFSAAVNNQCAETMNAICKNACSWQKGAMRICLYILGADQLILAAGLILCSLRNEGTHYFLSVFPKMYLINILIPQLILIGIAYIASCISEKNIIMANSFLGFILIMMSPLLEHFVWREKPKGIPIDRIIKKIRWIFSIFYQNAIWSPDTQYGLQTEDVRVELQLFWIFGIVAVLFWIYRKEDYRKKAAAFVCGGIAFVLAVCSYLPSSMYRLDESWDGIFEDMTYYSEEENGIPAPSGKEPDIKIEAYSLMIEISNRLKVDGELLLSSEKPKDEFILTLYHGYQVKEITSEEMEMEHERQKDQIILKFPEAVDQCTIRIAYEGCSGKYYSNSQAIMLPGYFPWYPMAGERQIFVQYPYYTGGIGYNPYNRVPQAEFTLTVNTRCDFVTNLKESADNVYVGKSDSISLIGGNIEKNENKILLNYLPLELNAETGQFYIDEIAGRWEQMLMEAEEVFGLDVEKLREKRIIMASKDMGRNFSNNYLVEFDDYILVSAGYLDIRTYMIYLLQNSGKKSRIGNLFATGLMRTDSILAERIIDTMISAEPENRQFMEELGEETEEGNVSGQLQYLKEQLGSEKLLWCIVDYLLDPDMETDEEFLRGL